MPGNIQEDLDVIEDRYGYSKLTKANSLISKLKSNYSEEEFDAAAKNFFSLDYPEADRSLYDNIKAAYRGKSYSGQKGGGCRYNTERSRCYADGSTDYSPLCIKTTGKKGKEGCSRNIEGQAKAAAGRTAKLQASGKKGMIWVENPLAGMQLGGGCRYNTERSRCYADGSTDYSPLCIKTTGKKGKEGCSRNIEGKAKAAAGRTAKLQATGKKGMIWVENPLASEQEGFEADWSDPAFNPINVDQLGGECGYMPTKGTKEGVEQFGGQRGGGCRYNTERSRCYADGSTDYSPLCIKTTGKKGKEGCARNIEGRATAAAGRAAKLHATGKKSTVWVENPLAGMQLGGGCRYNTERSRCYADGSTDYSPLCIKTTGKKGKEGCARNIEGRATAAAGRAAKLHAAGKKSTIWVENPLMQEGGLIYDGSDDIDVADQFGGGRYPGYTGRKMSEAAKAKAAATRARNAAAKAAAKAAGF